MYFHTDSPRTARWISAVAGTAADNGQRLRLNVDSEGNLTIKRGEGIWSAPIASTPDPYRDNGHLNMLNPVAEDVKVGDRIVSFGNIEVTEVDTVSEEFHTTLSFGDSGSTRIPNVNIVTVYRSPYV